MTCIFCKIIEGQIPCHKISEDDKYLIILDVNPVNKGHILVIPKEHIDYIFDMPDDKYVKLMLKAKEVAVFMKKKISTKRIGLVLEGFGVPHVHIHLVPINSGNELDPNRAKKATDEELTDVKENIYGIKEEDMK